MDRPTPPTFQIEGHRLGYPTRFRDGSSMMAVFLASSRRTQHLIARSSPFTVSEFLPGRAVVGINFVHYTDTDCGRYDEVAMSVFVEPFGAAANRFPSVAPLRRLARGEIASYAWMLGVNTTLSRDCGIEMWGFPKQLADLHHSLTAERARLAWRDKGSTVLELAVPTAGSRETGPLAPPVYSMIEGCPHVGYLHQRYRGVGYHRRGVQFMLGDHPIADELRRIGLSRRPLLAVSNAHLDFEMSAPEPLKALPVSLRKSRGYSRR